MLTDTMFKAEEETIKAVFAHTSGPAFAVCQVNDEDGTLVAIEISSSLRVISEAFSAYCKADAAQHLCIVTSAGQLTCFARGARP